MTRQTRGGTKKVRQTQDKECGYNELKACAVLVCEGAWVSQGRCPGRVSGRSGRGVSGSGTSLGWEEPAGPGAGLCLGPRCGSLRCQGL